MGLVGFEFMLSVVFLCAYVFKAKRFENKLIRRKYIVEKGFRIQWWILISVGIAFSCLQVVAIILSKFECGIFELGIFEIIFVWFCIHGIFAVMVLRIVWGLFKCFKQMKEQDIKV